MTPPIPDAAVDAAARTWFNNSAMAKEFGGWDCVPKSVVPVYLDRMRAALEAAAPLLAPRWIPVSERMPDADSYVIATDGRSVHEAKYDSGRYLKTPRMKWQDMRGHSANMKTTHWMPLPAPPADGAKEGG